MTLSHFHLQQNLKKEIIIRVKKSSLKKQASNVLCCIPFNPCRIKGKFAQMFYVALSLKALLLISNADIQMHIITLIQLPLGFSQILFVQCRPDSCQIVQ